MKQYLYVFQAIFNCNLTYKGINKMNKLAKRELKAFRTSVKTEIEGARKTYEKAEKKYKNALRKVLLSKFDSEEDFENQCEMEKIASCEFHQFTLRPEHITDLQILREMIVIHEYLIIGTKFVSEGK
jgi:hypothetical protein